MTYEVVLTKDAENDLDNFIQYLLFEKHSKQAAANVLQDFENTKRSFICSPVQRTEQKKTPLSFALKTRKNRRFSPVLPPLKITFCLFPATGGRSET